MKKYYILIVILFSAVNIISAQNMGMGRRSERDREKIEELERVKLIETLDMNEETSIKFFGRRKDFNDKMRDLSNQRDTKLDQLQKLIDDDTEDKNEQAYKRQIDDIVSIEKEITRTKAEFFRSLKDILSYRQISKMMVFERNFRRELRDLILKDRRKNFH